MPEGNEVVTGYMRLVPTLEGIQDEIAKQFGGAADAAAGEGDKAGGRFGGGMVKALAGAGIVAGVVGAFKGLYEIGSTFDEITDTIRVGTGAQGEALEGLSEVAKNIGTSIPTDFEAAGQTVADLNTRLGLSGDTLETVGKQYLEAGRILGEAVDVQATSAAFTAFGIEGQAVEGAMDSLFQVSQATGVGMNELASGVQTVAPALQNLGFGFDESVSLMGTLDKAGLNSTAILGSMSKGMINLAKDGEEPQAAFQRVTGEIQSFVDAGDTASALNLASEVFGTKGASQFVGALQDGVLNMDDLMSATGATGDTILGVGEETMDFAERWQITLNKAMEAFEPIATAVFTALGDGLTAAMPLLNDLGTWVGENTESVGVIAGVIGVALVAAFVAWTASIWASTIALLANPITWIVIGIVALIAAIVLLVLNWDTVVATITDIWGGFIGWITDGLNAFGAWWTEMWGGLGNWIVEIWTGFTTWVSEVFTNFLTGLQIIGAIISAWWNGLWTGIGDFIGGVWNWIVGAVTGYINLVLAVFTTVGALIGAVWSGLWNGIISFFTGAWDTIAGILGTIGDTFATVFNTIGDVIRGAFEGVVSFVTDLINNIIRPINDLIDGVNGITGVVGDAIGISLSIPNIPMLAKGGTVTGSGSVIVGERGPELLTLPRGATVDPDIGNANRGGPQVTQNIYGGDGTSAGEIARVASDQLNYELRGAR
ncbi:phage tail tape measure protein [Rathayibacter sp. AY1E1]|uniref:phage tail tape measure protein n=1 Tax=Rathayibacter sp. AY1E1 TaxID=2080549 RepID=UPI000CE8C3F8|nr:phage tail tape measure protein [Rathayibacter sp. AY1E1]PPH51196.1 phage tail tape measure protein [Rathayibacter sp. AY1E1]